MQSKISIDFDFQNKPILKIIHGDTSDVRDKLVGQFLSKSPFFKLSDGESGGQDFDNNTSYTEVELETVEPTETKELIKKIEDWRRKNYTIIEMESGYSFSTLKKISDSDDNSKFILKEEEEIIGVPKKLLEEKISFIRLFKGEYFSLQELIDYNPHFRGPSSE